MQLYEIAWNVAVFAAVWSYHHSIDRKNIIPIPHPMKSGKKSWKRLLAVAKNSMVIRYLKN